MLEKYMSKPDIEKEKIQKNCEKEPFNFRTDLATERRDLYRTANRIENEIEGIESDNEEINENIPLERVNITKRTHSIIIRRNKYRKHSNKYAISRCNIIRQKRKRNSKGWRNNLTITTRSKNTI